MIAGRDFIVISDDYHGLPTSAIHLFRRLAQQNRVFWFNTICRFPRLTLIDAGSTLRTVGAWAFRLSGLNGRRPRHQATGSANLQVITPFMVPSFKPFLRRLNCRSMFGQYARLHAGHAIVDPIVVTTVPYGVDFVKAVPESLKIYYCVDDWLDYPGVNHADWTVMEGELLETIDGLVITSQALAHKRLNGCPLLHLPHGVDFESFHAAAMRREPEPRLEGLRRPIVGFFGLISEWVDLEMIAHLSEAFPEVSFVIIGQARVSLAPLAGRSNVHCLGLVPYAELPRYARYFDVGLIPFVLNQLTHAVNPLKLMEYFALGLPVLATRLPELERLPGPLWLAVSRPEFRASLAEILKAGPGFRKEEAVAVARQNRWDQRIEQLSAFLEDLGTAKAMEPSLVGEND